MPSIDRQITLFASQHTDCISAQAVNKLKKHVVFVGRYKLVPLHNERTFGYFVLLISKKNISKIINVEPSLKTFKC